MRLPAALAVLVLLPAASALPVPGLAPTYVYAYPHTLNGIPAIDPDAELELPLEVSFSYQETFPSPNPLRITLEVAALPGWAHADLRPADLEVEVPTVPCACWRQVELDAVLVLRAAPDAPALEPGALALRVVSHGNDVYDASESTSEFPIVAGLTGRTELRLRQSELGLPAGGARSVTMEVANRANGAVEVAFTVLRAPQGVHVVAPGPLPLARRGQGEADHALVEWRVEAERGFEDGDAVLLVRGLLGAPGGDSTADKVTLRIHHEDAGPVVVQKAGAWPVAPLVLLGAAAAGMALAGALWLRRRRR
jgi:hypothetical protein